MVRLSGFFIAAIMVFGITCSVSAWAETTPPPATPPAETKCALDEAPVTENGATVCRKVPSCNKKDEAISYDTATQKFMCKKLVLCDPKRQQAAYVDGKNVCIDIPNCEAQGRSYAFDGTKMVCK